MSAVSVGTRPMTYEEYLSEGETNWRYDIIDGVRHDMPNPTRSHQEIAGNLFVAMRAYGRANGLGKAIIAPSDVLIRRSPLRTRQPDVLFMSSERLARCGDPDNPEPLTVAPELVVEVLSPSETRAIRAAKLADYCAVGVNECWVVSPDALTVEVLRLETTGEQSVAVYGMGQTAQSLVFPDLAVSVEAVFEA